MSESTEQSTETCWFVGAAFGRTDDQTQRFIENGIWEDGDRQKHSEQILLIPPGARIAIKSTYVQKNDLRFDNRGLPVSVMAIKATGIVTENLGDGFSLKVNWDKIEPSRKWYFYTYQPTLVQDNFRDQEKRVPILSECKLVKTTLTEKELFYEKL